MTDPDFDLDAYLHRIDCNIAREPSLAALEALCRAHPAAIAFENIDPLLGRAPGLNLRDIQTKLVAQRRGGYCFEQNALLRQALIAFGFEVRSLAARVVWMSPPSLPPRPRTHMLLLVEGEHRHLVDGGFGGHLINVPLRLEPGLEQSSPASRMRISLVDDTYTLESHLAEAWSPLYRFRLEPQLPADYEPLNWFTATHPLSIFRHNLLMERLTPAVRANLLNDKLTLRAPGEAPRMRRIESSEEFGRVMTEVFGLRLPASAADVFDKVPKRRDGVVLPSA